ncbi:hypothetical protein FA95DRAFT_882065 [Auriscalpium vulgare]|uniref:Uncharacterized protein n=1 Tax=Auriscalpium vulgare TaxID=40419 RepID=A0ACB8S0R3_9AGAM|nr:hypothetical protein FA95DRAFT_882065 [Auriscalpium vulgare]
MHRLPAAEFPFNGLQIALQYVNARCVYVTYISRATSTLSMFHGERGGWAPAEASRLSGTVRWRKLRCRRCPRLEDRWSAAAGDGDVVPENAESTRRDRVPPCLVRERRHPRQSKHRSEPIHSDLMLCDWKYLGVSRSPHGAASDSVLVVELEVCVIQKRWALPIYDSQTFSFDGQTYSDRGLI